MRLENIGLDPEMNGHDFRQKMWKYEQPSFRFYYKIDKNTRTRCKKKISKIQSRLQGQLR